MSRRITFRTIEKINSDEAIQPRQGDRIARLVETLLEELTSEAKNRDRGMTVIHVSSTKEVKSEGETASSKVDHREETLIIYEHLPQSTASKEVAGGDEAPRPSESDRRLVKLKRTIWQRLDKLLFDCFLQELAKTAGKEVAKALVALLAKWLPILVALYLIFKH